MVDFHGLDLNLLVALDALLVEKNVTRAGMRIHLTQSSMSGALARLRSYFRDELLVPLGRGLVLTPLAENLVRPLREILMRIESAITAEPKFDPLSSQRRFVIEASSFVIAVLLTNVLQRAEKEAPGVTFDILQLNDATQESLANCMIDFAILPTQDLLSGHPSSALFSDGHTCIAWSKNPKLRRGLSRQLYDTLGHVVIHFGHSTPLEWATVPGVYPRKTSALAPDFDALVRLVVGTERIAILPTRLAMTFAKLYPIKMLKPPVELPVLSEALQWHSYKDRDPGCIWLRTLIQETAAKLSTTALRRARGAF